MYNTVRLIIRTSMLDGSTFHFQVLGCRWSDCVTAQIQFFQDWIKQSDWL